MFRYTPPVHSRDGRYFARSLSRPLNHPHIVTLHEVGVSDTGPYLVMEKVEGRSLAELLRAGPLPVKRILAIGAQIAEGLAKAHAAGIVHRDLKPDNVMVTDDGFAKILDFGLAKLVWPDLDGSGQTETAALATGPFQRWRRPVRFRRRSRSAAIPPSAP